MKIMEEKSPLGPGWGIKLQCCQRPGPGSRKLPWGWNEIEDDCVYLCVCVYLS